MGPVHLVVGATVLKSTIREKRIGITSSNLTFVMRKRGHVEQVGDGGRSNGALVLPLPSVVTGALWLCLTVGEVWGERRSEESVVVLERRQELLETWLSHGGAMDLPQAFGISDVFEARSQIGGDSAEACLDGIEDVLPAGVQFAFHLALFHDDFFLRCYEVIDRHLRHASCLHPELQFQIGRQAGQQLNHLPEERFEEGRGGLELGQEFLEIGLSHGGAKNLPQAFGIGDLFEARGQINRDGAEAYLEGVENGFAPGLDLRLGLHLSLRFFHGDLFPGRYVVIDRHAQQLSRVGFELQFQVPGQAGEGVNRLPQVECLLPAEAKLGEVLQELEPPSVSVRRIMRGGQCELMRGDDQGEWVAGVAKDLFRVGHIQNFEDGKLEAETATAEGCFIGRRSPVGIVVGEHGEADDALRELVPDPVVIGPHPQGKTTVAVGLNFHMDEEPFLASVPQAHLDQFVHCAATLFMVRTQLLEFGVKELGWRLPVDEFVDGREAELEERAQVVFERRFPRSVKVVGDTLLVGHTGADYRQSCLLPRLFSRDSRSAGISLFWSGEGERMQPALKQMFLSS